MLFVFLYMPDNIIKDLTEEEIKLMCPLRKNACCGKIVAICELCQDSFEKETIEQLLLCKTGQNFFLQIRKEDIS